MTDLGPRRYSRQQQQEFRSRDQLADRLDEYGWIPSSIARDLGEDFLVRIYDEGISSGLSLFVQLKSSNALDQFRLRGGDMSYPFEVKDLLHWEASAVPVFIVLWDVKLQGGYWVGVADAIRDLDRRRPSWRGQKTVHVRMPDPNRLDDDGLARLRRIVADYYYPVISKDRVLEIHTRFLFPSTPEGKAANIALERHFATGAQVEIDGQYIEEFRFSEWWTRLYGEIDMSEGLLAIGPSSSEETLPVSFDAISDDDQTASIPYVELRVSQAGTEQETLTNQHQTMPLRFSLEWNCATENINVSIRLANPGANVEEMLQAFRFLRVLSMDRRLRVNWLKTGKSFEAKAPLTDLISPNPEFITALEKLCLIENKTGHSLPPLKNWALGTKDLDAIDELVSIIESGQISWRDRVFTGTFKKFALNLFLAPHKAAQTIDLTVRAPGGYVELLGEKISTGPFTQFISGQLDIPADELEEVVASMEADDELEVRLVDAEVVEMFDDWPKSGG